MDNNFRVNRGLTLNPQTTSPPSNPVNGDIYYDAAANTYIFYDNGFWINLASRTDVPSATTLTSAQFTVAVVQNSLIRVTGSTFSNLYGLAASTAGKPVVIYNESSQPLLINDNSATEPVAANRILTFNGADTTVAAGQVVQLVYDDSQQRWIIMSSPGTGGSGLLNYIANNPSGQSGTLGWVLYQNTAANIPITGTGGSPTGLTFVSSTVSPLRGTTSFILTQANSTDVQGSGVSYDFTIDPADEAKVLAVSFDYNASQPFTASDGVTTPLNDGTTSTNAGNSDIEVFIYDITNAVLLPVTPEVITAKGTNNFSFAGIFQTSPNSTSYRLILHAATANTYPTGWQFQFVNVFVGPQVFGIGANSQNPTQTILTSGSGTYSPPSGASYIRVRMVGGGGGGGGSGDGGSGGSGGIGGNTTFGTSLLTANGGGGGGGGASPGGGVGGTAVITGLTGLAIQGGGGAPASGNNTTGDVAIGGLGGASALGGAGFGGSPYGGANPGGDGAANSGGGAGGAGPGTSPTSYSGGGGGSGGFIDVIITNPTSSYAYSVGTSGTPGTAGSGGAAGGNGGSGIVVIDEFYLNGGSSEASSGQKAPTIQVFPAGSGTYTLPSGVSYIEVEMIGGGGGGGPNGVSGGTGGTGGTTTFGTSLLTATGGGGGAAYYAGQGAPGTATVSSPALQIVAVSGGYGSPMTEGGLNTSGTMGGVSPFGGAGSGTNLGSGASTAAPNTGSGGGGAPNGTSGNPSGGGGSSGGYLVAQINNPSATYPYLIGAGGTGASGAGAGGSGVIIVREFYGSGGGGGIGAVTPFSALVTSPSVHPIGAIMSAYLTEAQFQYQMGPGWILQDGRSVAGSSYATLTGNTTVPDARGMFIRGSGTNAAQTLQNGGFPVGAALGAYQQDEFASHDHTIPFAPISNTVPSGSGGTGISGTTVTGFTGGAETRPVSVSANHFIKIN